MRLCETGRGRVARRPPTPAARPSSDVDDDVRHAVAALVERRLLVIDRDTVEVAHEALLREWPRLRAWMDEDVQGRRLHRRLSEAARAWTASGEDTSELYRGTRLDSALDWAATNPGDLSVSEQAFVDASANEAAREIDEAHRRAVDKARDNRRLRWSLIGVAGLLVIAVVAGLLFVRQRDRAERTARQARAQRAGQRVDSGDRRGPGAGDLARPRSGRHHPARSAAIRCRKRSARCSEQRRRRGSSTGATRRSSSSTSTTTAPGSPRARPPTAAPC